MKINSLETDRAVEMRISDPLEEGDSIMPTAKIYAVNPKTGRRVMTRLLADSGAQSTCVEKSLVEELGLTTFPENTTLNGLGGRAKMRVKEAVLFKIKSRNSRFELMIRALPLL